MRITKASRLRGRISVGALLQNNQEANKFDVVEPSVSLRLQIENLLDTRHQLAIRVRGRQTERTGNAAFGLNSGWSGRVYEAALSFDNPQAAYSYSAGRVLSGRLRGIGYFDGIAVERKAGSGLRVGAFGGTQPDPVTSEPTADHTKFGWYGSYQSGSYAQKLWQATLAAAGQYRKRNIDREFVYEQVGYSRGTSLWLQQSAEVNVNRGWLKRAGAPSIEVVNLLLSAKYVPTPSVATTMSYDTRTNYRTLDTRSTPDSRLQGLQIGAQWRALKHLRIGAGGGWREMKSSGTDARNYTTDFRLENWPVQGSSVSMAALGFTNSFTRGTQPSLSISQYITPSLSGGLQIGVNKYNYRQRNQTIQNNGLRIRSDANFTRALYGSAYYEVYGGDGPSLTRIFVETGVRL